MASRGPASWSGGEQRTGRAPGTARIAPLYKRLPHGPHRLPRAAVIRHQRARIHGAMVEAVAQSGYWGTSVKQVIGLAGVSRRCFYEQFANKQECFLATFDLLAGRALRQTIEAYGAVDGGVEQHLDAIFGELTSAAELEPKPARLLALEAQTAGAAGTLRLRSATATCEQLLARSFAEPPATGALPRPIVRGVAGGLHAILSDWLRERPPARAGEHVAAEMLRYALCFQTPHARRIGELLGERSARVLRQEPRARRERTPQTARAGAGAGAGQRGQLLEAVLRLAVVEGYRELSAPQIAEEAGVPIEVFFGSFAGKRECFLAALDALGEELLQITAAAVAAEEDWVQGVRGALGELMAHLAAHPLRARILSQAAFAAGPEAVGRNLELAQRLARSLSAGAPAQGHAELFVQGASGAILHTVRCQATGGRVELLPALSDHLAYVVLAPSIGAERAVEAVVAEPAR